MIWAKIKAALNSTLGTKDFKPLDKIIEDGFQEVSEIQNSIREAADTTLQNLKSGENDYIVKMSKMGATIVTGSYVGTGKYGSGNPCTLSFDSPIAMLIILPEVTRYAPAETLGDGEFTSYHKSPLSIFGTTHDPIVYRSTNNDAEVATIVKFDHTVEWYSSSEKYQRNIAGTTYRYIAFLKGGFVDENN